MLWLSSGTLLLVPEVAVAVLLVVAAGVHTLLYMRPHARRVLLTDQQKRLLGIHDSGGICSVVWGHVICGVCRTGCDVM